MKLQAQSSKLLREALQKSAKCMTTKNVVAIFNNVLLTMKERDKFFFTSSTGESQLTVPAPLTIVEGEFTSPIALSVNVVILFLSTLPDCTITFDFAKNNQSVEMTYCTGDVDHVKTGKASVPCEDGKAFTFMKSVDAACTHIQLPMAVVDEVLSQARNFLAEDLLRPVMSVLCVDVAEDKSEVVFVGTDGNILYKRNHSNDEQKGGSDFFRSGESRKTLIHRNYFKILSAFDGCETVDIENDGHVIRFSSGDIELICKHIEGKYPNYNSVIPKSSPYYVVFDKKEMLGILRRVSLFSSSVSNLIEVEKNGMFLIVSASDSDFAKSGEDQVFLSEAACTDGFKIGLKYDSFRTCISAIPSNTIRMRLLDNSHAVVFTADEPAPNVLALEMPMLLDE